MSDQNGIPIEITPVEEELNRQLLQDFTGERTGFLRVGPQGYFLPSKYASEAKNLYNFKPRPTDTWVVTFPRSGTTWTQELVWLIANKLDFETAKQIPQTERFPFFEFSLFLHDETKEEFIQENAADPKKVELVQQLSKPGYQTLEETSGPRFIKTHLPFSLLPRNLLQVGCKVIYVARNPKDVAVSFYHLNRLIRTQGYRGDFPKYWDYFEKSLNPWTPYWSHVNEGWQLRDHPNVLFLFYEEMNKDIKKTINRVSEFLNGRQLSAEDTDRLANFLDISNFRKNPAVNYQPLKEAGILIEGEEGFIRKGLKPNTTNLNTKGGIIVNGNKNAVKRLSSNIEAELRRQLAAVEGKTGGWVEEFTPELNKRADEWINDNLKHTDLRFPGMCDA